MRPEPLAFPSDQIILLREKRTRAPQPVRIRSIEQNPDHTIDPSHLPKSVLTIDTHLMNEHTMDLILSHARSGASFLLEFFDELTGRTSYSKLISSRAIIKFETSLELFKFLKCGFACGKDKGDSAFRTISVDDNRPLAKPIDESLIHEELMGLATTQCIFHKMQYAVFIVEPEHAPNTLLEIGRLRETTFREVGEGTGKPRDLDEFDGYYYQLIIYDTDRRKIVGGYRLAHGPQLMRNKGVEGFYIHRLFELKDDFSDIMRFSVELGRSYIVADYQKQRLPLFLLWRGIFHFLQEHPEIKYLYGPVSISKYYSDLSKGFIIEFLKRHYYNEDLASMVKSRKAFRPITGPFNYDRTIRKMGSRIQDLDQLIEEIDPRYFKIPVLMRQYIRQNAKFIGFNVDPNFSDALDGFMILDLRNVPTQTLESLRNIG